MTQETKVIYRTGKYKTWKEETVNVPKMATREQIKSALQVKLGINIHEAQKA